MDCQSLGGSGISAGLSVVRRRPLLGATHLRPVRATRGNGRSTHSFKIGERSSVTGVLAGSGSPVSIRRGGFLMVMLRQRAAFAALVCACVISACDDPPAQQQASTPAGGNKTPP